MKHKLIRKLKQLGATLGTFLSLAGMVYLTGATANRYLTHGQFFIGMATLTVVVLGCISYINGQMEGGEWIE